MHPWVGLSDHVRLGTVARWVTPQLVAEALDDCGVMDKKPGALPAGFMVYFTLALVLLENRILALTCVSLSSGGGSLVLVDQAAQDRFSPYLAGV